MTGRVAGIGETVCDETKRRAITRTGGLLRRWHGPGRLEVELYNSLKKIGKTDFSVLCFGADAHLTAYRLGRIVEPR
jgi:hypothetical protein